MMMLGSSERRKGFAGKKGRTPSPSFLPSLFWWKAQAKLQESSFDSNSRDIQGITAEQGRSKRPGLGCVNSLMRPEVRRMQIVQPRTIHFGPPRAQAQPQMRIYSPWDGVNRPIDRVNKTPSPLRLCISSLRALPPFLSLPPLLTSSFSEVTQS